MNNVPRVPDFSRLFGSIRTVNEAANISAQIRENQESALRSRRALMRNIEASNEEMNKQRQESLQRELDALELSRGILESQKALVAEQRRQSRDHRVDRRIQVAILMLAAVTLVTMVVIALM